MRWTRLLLCRLSSGPPPSALYVSGRSADRVVSVLWPCLDDSLSPRNLPALKESLRRRRCQADLDALLSDWQSLLKLETEKEALLQRRAETASRGAQLRKQPQSPEGDEEMARLRSIGAEVKRALRQIQEPVWDMQEQVLPRLASLPNTLHSQTPDEDVLGTFPTPRTDWIPAPLQEDDDDDSPFATDVEPSSVSAGAYYLHGSAAACELALMDFAAEQLYNAGFRRVSCPDTVKSLVADGCGLSFADAEAVTRLSPWHEGSPESPLGLHLVGGASLPALCSLLTKTRQRTDTLPLRLCSTGRVYQPPRATSWPSPPPQSSAVRHFTACASQAEADDAYDACVSLLKELIEKLGIAYRVRQVAAAWLVRSERRRTELQLLTAEGYITAAHVSCQGDYISRRLHMAHARTSESDSALLYVVEGFAVLVPVVLHALMRGERRLSQWPACLEPFTYPSQL